LPDQIALSIIGKAVTILRKVTHTDPGYSTAWRDVSALYNGLGDHKSALLAARKVAELDPENCDSWYILGVALGKAGNSQEAIRALSKAMALNPGHSGALRSLEKLSKKVT
jgi:Flp pilus assembly protein TadD